MVLGCVALAACGGAGERTPTTDRGDPGDPLAGLAWLSGTWVSFEDAVRSEEVWTAPAGATMFGINRTVRAGRTVHYEWLKIERRADGIYYVASPQGQTTADFRLTSAREGQAVFENPAHDFPQRIEYRRTGDSLVARVSGTDRVEEWSWTLRD